MTCLGSGCYAGIQRCSRRAKRVIKGTGKGGEIPRYRLDVACHLIVYNRTPAPDLFLSTGQPSPVSPFIILFHLHYLNSSSSSSTITSHIHHPFPSLLTLVAQSPTPKYHIAHPQYASRSHVRHTHYQATDGGCLSGLWEGVSQEYHRSLETGAPWVCTRSLLERRASWGCQKNYSTRSKGYSCNTRKPGRVGSLCLVARGIISHLTTSIASSLHIE